MLVQPKDIGLLHRMTEDRLRRDDNITGAASRQYQRCEVVEAMKSNSVDTKFALLKPRNYFWLGGCFRTVIPACHKQGYIYRVIFRDKPSISYHLWLSVTMFHCKLTTINDRSMIT